MEKFMNWLSGLGINALDAARIGLTACDALRTTFRDEDGIRFHPIITKGGDVVNSVPDEVVVDTYVRGATLDAIKKGNNITLLTLEKLCFILDCTPNDVIRFQK